MSLLGTHYESVFYSVGHVTQTSDEAALPNDILIYSTDKLFISKHIESVRMHNSLFVLFIRK